MKKQEIGSTYDEALPGKDGYNPPMADSCPHNPHRGRCPVTTSMQPVKNKHNRD